MTKDNICIENTEHKISLLSHNQKLFDEVMEAVNNGEHSIFFSQATGLGKSFVFMRLVYDLFTNEGNKVLYIVPKIAIWENIQTYKEFEYIKDYIEMTTYADFNSTKIKHYDYDAIFIDECHHLISDIQGVNIRELCDEYVNENRYVFGFTATPEVGTPKTNVDKYFSAKIYGMDLIEAIESGIFKKIEYAIADHDTIVDDKEYCKKYSIDSTKTLLENIIAERSDITRWLVYFSNISALHKNFESIKKLFPDFKIFMMHSQNDNNDEQLKEFNSYKGKSMLLTVSMVLEGVHPESVSGILIYRNIISNNTFLQVLGRICNIHMKTSPLCVDITNSIFNIKESDMGKFIHNNYNSKCKKRNIRDIIDIKASSYKYIELITNIYDLFTNHEYRGITWKSDTDLSRKLGISNSYIGYHKKLGKTYEEIIDYILDKKENEYRGITWKSDKELSIKLGMSRSYVGEHKMLGETYEQIIDYILDDKENEYRGIIWKSDCNLSRKLGMGDGYVGAHKKLGKTYEEIIDYILDNKNKNTEHEYRGIIWKSDADLSRKLGMCNTYVCNHKRSGETYEQIIDYILDDKENEYRGIIWKSDADLSRKLGMERSYVRAHKMLGETYEQIIDYILDNKNKNMKHEYRGIIWKSDADLSRKLGMGNGYVNKNIKLGKTYEQIIDYILDKKEISIVL